MDEDASAIGCLFTAIIWAVCLRFLYISGMLFESDGILNVIVSLLLSLVAGLILAIFFLSTLDAMGEIIIAVISIPKIIKEKREKREIEKQIRKEKENWQRKYGAAVQALRTKLQGMSVCWCGIEDEVYDEINLCLEKYGDFLVDFKPYKYRMDTRQVQNSHIEEVSVWDGYSFGCDMGSHTETQTVYDEGYHSEEFEVLDQKQSIFILPPNQNKK